MSEAITIHVHAPKSTDRAINTQECGDCKKRSRFIHIFTPWYGWDSTCLKCGRSWADGEWMALPFMRGSRQRNIDYAKKRYRNMVKESSHE